MTNTESPKVNSSGFRTHTHACIDNAAVRAFNNDPSIALYPSPEATTMGREYLASTIVDCICTEVVLTAITCDYGPAGEIATRVTDSDEPLCSKHAREHYGADWKTETRTLGAQATARINAARA